VLGIGCQDQSCETSRDYSKGQRRSCDMSCDLSGSEQRLHKSMRLGIEQDTTRDLEDI